MFDNKNLDASYNFQVENIMLQQGLHSLKIDRYWAGQMYFKETMEGAQQQIDI